MANHGKFSDLDPQTQWAVEQHPDRTMRLLREFYFIDPDNKTWLAPLGYAKMDGASIPRALWTLVGSPYTGDYRRASIVHDKACDDAGGDADKRAQADKMFFHACMAGGCSWEFAVVLYIGVRIGAWTSAVSVWKSPTNGAHEYHLALDSSEQRVQADFRLIADKVLAQGKTEDAEEVEARVNSARDEVLAKSSK